MLIKWLKVRSIYVEFFACLSRFARARTFFRVLDFAFGSLMCGAVVSCVSYQSLRVVRPSARDIYATYTRHGHVKRIYISIKECIYIRSVGQCMENRKKLVLYGG